ncbi:TonB-dependent receptor [Hymenobacter tenuis]
MIVLMQTISAPVWAQDSQPLTGRVTDKNGAGLPGATVVVKGTSIGTSTDERGGFTLSNAPAGNLTLAISFIGYVSKEITLTSSQRGKALSVNLDSDSRQMDEVVVTGVFDKRERMDASIAISTLSAKEITLQAPVSAAELLKNVPGVFVNSSLGEIRNTVYSRGVSAGSVEAASGYFYVSMQEDGLPVTNVTFDNYGPDYFLRADATIGRLEAVRGGSAAITGPNAPGGIFNYVSKSGSNAFGGEFRAKYGIEGDGNGFYRGDLNLGGKLNEKGDWTYNVGGFYRYAQGARNPGYPMSVGGQIKANLTKTYDRGSLKLYGKFLNDRNGFFEFLPATNFDNPSLAPGVKNTDTYLPSKRLAFDYPQNSGTNIQSFDASRLTHSYDRAIGLDWQHDLGSGWSFQNNVKYTNKSREWNSGGLISAVALDNFYPYFFVGGISTFGTFTFTDLTTGRKVATYSQVPNIDPNTGQFLGFNYIPGSDNNIPGQGVQANSVLFTDLLVNTTKVQEVMDQGSVSKKFGENVTVTAGAYIGVSHLSYESGSAGIGLSTIENNPHPLGVSATDFNGDTYQFTNPQGAASLGTFLAGFTLNDYRQTQIAGFSGLTWKITPMLTFDGGLRVDNVRVKGFNRLASPSTNTDPNFGGVDGNRFTVYDNLYGAPSTTYNIDKTLQTVAYSAALNYRLSPSMAFYGRYSDGRKAPDLAFYFGINSPITFEQFDPQAQRVQQAELGLKYQGEKYSVFATPFYSLLSNVINKTVGQNVDGTLYGTPSTFNSIRTLGLELESTYNFTDHFSVRGVATLQRATANVWNNWNLGANGQDDDKLVSYSGNRADNVPNVMLNVAPTYSGEKFTLFGNYRYLGSRAANVAQTFDLPGFSQVDLGAGYNVTKALSLQANVNNVLGGEGVMGFQAPGGFPASLDRQGFTPDKLAANPDAVFSILTIQPRSYYLSLSYKF